MTRAGLEVTRTSHMEIEYDLFGWAQSALNNVVREPNQFFNQVSGRPVAASPVSKAVVLGAGAVLTVAAAPLAALGALTARGGIVAMAARRRA